MQEDRASVKRIVAAVAVLASLGAVAVAQGVVVQEFSFQIKDIKKWGAYTVVFSSRSYDPSGGIPDELNQNYLRLPKGADGAQGVQATSASTARRRSWSTRCAWTRAAAASRRTWTSS